MLVTAPLLAEAQQRDGVHRVGFLALLTPALAEPSLKSFLKHLQAIGYTQGDNLIFDVRYAHGDNAKFAPLAKELVAARPDVLVAVTTPAVVAARAASTSTPIVMLYGGAPVEIGLAASLARPGGNVTGLVYQGPETAGKIHQVLKDVLPHVRRVAVLWEDSVPGMSLYADEANRAAASLGISPINIPISSAADLEQALLRLRKERPDALYVAPTGVLAREGVRIIEFAARERFPAIYTSGTWVQRGGLMSYSDVRDHLRDGARFVDAILKGAKPADLPIEQPTQYEFAINLRTARALGLVIPRDLLLRADRVIE